jgi:hypothetical protein
MQAITHRKEWTRFTPRECNIVAAVQKQPVRTGSLFPCAGSNLFNSDPPPLYLITCDNMHHPDVRLPSINLKHPAAARVGAMFELA